LLFDPAGALSENMAQHQELRLVARAGGAKAQVQTQQQARAERQPALHRSREQRRRALAGQ
jgi:hypothetical protein